jgi:hypothetical protein
MWNSTQQQQWRILEDEGEEDNEENSVQIEEEIDKQNELHFRGKKI